MGGAFLLGCHLNLSGLLLLYLYFCINLEDYNKVKLRDSRPVQKPGIYKDRHLAKPCVESNPHRGDSL